MIRVRQVKINVRSNDLKSKIASKLKVKESDILDYKIIKESIDSRNKPDIYYVYELDVNVQNESAILKKNKST